MKFKHFLIGILLFIPSIFSQNSINQFLGCNVDARNPIERVKRFPFVRNYHDFSKDTGYPDAANFITCPPTFSLEWSPSQDGSAYYSFDQFYKTMSGKVSPSLKGVHPSMFGYNNYPNCWNASCANNTQPSNYLCNSASVFEMKPYCNAALNGNQEANCVLPGTNPGTQDYLAEIGDATDPAGFVAVAKWVTLYAARYGYTEYPEQSTYVQEFIKSNLSPDESLETGLEYTTFVEPNNEPDKSWYEDATTINLQLASPSQAITYWYFAPEQYAALVSACYDGHGRSPAFKINEINNEDHFYGAKNADANIIISVFYRMAKKEILYSNRKLS